MTMPSPRTILTRPDFMTTKLPILPSGGLTPCFLAFPRSWRGVGLISGFTSGLTSFALPFAASPLVAGVSSVASTGFGSSNRGKRFGNWNMNSLFSGPS